MGPNPSGTHRYRSATEIPSTHRVFMPMGPNPSGTHRYRSGTKIPSTHRVFMPMGPKSSGTHRYIQIWHGNPFNSPRVQAGMGPKSSGTHRYRSGTEIFRLTACSGMGSKPPGTHRYIIQIWDGNLSPHCVFKHGPRSLVACRLFRLVVEGYVHDTYLHTNSKHWFTTSFLQGRCRKAMLGV